MKLRKKLFTAMIGISVMAVFVVGTASIFQLFDIKKRIILTRQEENAELFEENVSIMTDSAKESMCALAVGYAEGISDNIKSIENFVSLIAMDIGDLYDKETESIPEIQDNYVYLQPNVEWKEVEAEFSKIKGARNLIYNAAKIYSDISLIYYVSKSGMLISNVEVDYHAGDDEIDRRTREWYTGAIKAGGVYWTDIYKDALSGEQALTCSCPVYDRNGNICGVIAQDIYLDSICNAILTNSSDLFEYSFIVDAEGEKIAGNKSQDNQEIEGEIQEIINSGSNSSVEIYPNKHTVIGHARIRLNGWSFFVLMDYDTITRPADNVGESIIRSNNQFLEFLDEKIRGAYLLFLFIIVCMIGVVFLAASRIAKSIVKPVEELTDGVKKISAGNLDYQITTKSDGEIGELATAFWKMTIDLQDYIKNLEHVTAEKERIGAELDIATNIQKSMLPCIFPAFPDRKEIDIYASMNPAKEVGGDFYDFFMVDETHLAIVMADVSGKGVPAALFMVIGKTLIKDHTKQGRDLGEVFSEVNDLLCESNSEGLFITAFEGVLDLVTGEFWFVNAGHETPFICKKGGVFKPYPLKAGFVLAGIEGMKYQCSSMQLEPGDKIFQYTDGVTEAADSENELYGMKRLNRVLSECSGLVCAELLQKVKEDIDAFVGDAPQFDDITMLCMEYKGRM